jgi:hypothetical protein
MESEKGTGGGGERGIEMKDGGWLLLWQECRVEQDQRMARKKRAAQRLGWLPEKPLPAHPRRRLDQMGETCQVSSAERLTFIGPWRRKCPFYPAQLPGDGIKFPRQVRLPGQHGIPHLCERQRVLTWCLLRHGKEKGLRKRVSCRSVSLGRRDETQVGGERPRRGACRIRQGMPEDL